MIRAGVLVVAIAACGGSPPPAEAPRPPAGPVDPAAMRALLERYSPSGHAIVAAFEALPLTFHLPLGPYEFGAPSQGFDSYLRDDGIENVVTYESTAVHEVTHGYITRRAFQMLEERQGSVGAGVMAVFADGDPILVRMTATFPSRELDATFPADARTTRYTEYILEEDPDFVTQQFGVYGLLDELTAYYQDGRVVLDFWPWVRDEAPADRLLMINYAALLDDIRYARAEISLYILHYVQHAREQRPDVYEALMANADFRRALVAVDDAYTALVERAAALEPEVFALARQRGATLTREGGALFLDGRQLRAADHAPYAAELAHRESPAYRAIAESLR